MHPAFRLPLTETFLNDPKVLYAALCARDARQDGIFYVGVTSTGIYCRPVCRVRPPKFENCRFFATALRAQAAGFRPCRRCRPELAPADAAWSIQDVSNSLAQAAVNLLNPQRLPGAPLVAVSVQKVAEKLGISERHLQRVMLQSFGLSPKTYLKQARISLARRLLADTTLSLGQIAQTSGYGSLRTLQREFAQLDGRAPSSLRRVRDDQASASENVCVLAYRPPYALVPLLHFLAERAVPGIEVVNLQPTAKFHWARSVALASSDGLVTGWVRVRFEPNQHRLRMWAARSLQAYLPALQTQVAAVFDLGAPIPLIEKALAKAPFSVPHGLRVPGALDPFELIVRAVLGQQVTVAAGNTLLTRFARTFGQAMVTPVKGLDWCFPVPGEVLALGDGLAPAMGALGITKMRQQAIAAAAQALHEGTLDLRPGAPALPALQVLQALPGIGPWTAHYVVMRTLKWSNAWMPSDVAVHQALGLLSDQPRAPLARRIQITQDVAEAWQPWRSYGLMAAWQSLTPLSSPLKEAP